MKHYVAMMCILLLLLGSGCQKQAVITDDFRESVLTEQAATDIIAALGRNDSVAFEESDGISMDQAIESYWHLAVLTLKGELRKEAEPYFVDGKMQLPAKMLETYLQERFNISPAVKKSERYDAESDTYVFANPLMLENAHVRILELTPLEDQQYDVLAMVQHDDYFEKLAVRIRCDKGYQILSLEIVDPMANVNSDEKKELLTIFEKLCYSGVQPNIQFEKNADYRDVFPYFSVYMHGEDGEILSELVPYATGKPWEAYEIPAKIVEDVLLSLFPTEVKRQDIAEYDAETECYTVTPFFGDWYFEAEMVGFQKSEDLYMLEMVQRNCFDFEESTSYALTVRRTNDGYRILRFEKTE